MKLKNIKINWLDVFSNWIFLASITYPIHGISTFPLNILAAPVAIKLFFVRKNDIILQQIISLVVHFFPFFIVPYDLSCKVIHWNILFMIIYVIIMYIKKINIFDVYHTIFNKKNKYKTINEYIKSRI
jgi:hypothetical protein